MDRPAFHLLGTPTLFDAGGSPIAGGPAQRHRIALLAQLVVAAPHAVSRDRLIGLLWPDRDTATGRRNLNVGVSVVRQSLGADVIVTAGDDLRLGAGTLATDVEQFEHALEQGRMEDAVACSRGVFLEGFFLDDAVEFERWVEAQRLKFARRYVNAITVLAERATREGKQDTAIGWWRALVHAEPTNPMAVLQLFDALVAAGDVSGALAAAEAHAAYLRGEIGIEPDARVTARGDALRAAMVGVKPPATIPRVTPVVTPTDALPTTGAVPSRRRHRWRILAAAVVLLAGAAAWELPRARAGNGRDLVALLVAPVHDPDLSLSDADDFANLLALNLDQVDGVRIELVKPADAGSEARAHHAAFTINGRLSRQDNSLVATFTVVDSTGGLVGRATASAPRSPDAPPGLVDAISVRVLQLLWGRRWLVPEPRVAAISTASLPAMREFLRGEQEFRVSHWESAATHYQAAADLDSTFSLAYFRLAETDGWRGHVAQDVIAGLLEHAGRSADRLPLREQLLLHYRQLFASHDYGAIDVARDLAERYPDDPDAQFALADVLWHARGGIPISRREEAERWDTAVAVDKTSLRPLEHALDLARELQDKRRYDRFLALRMARGGDTLPTYKQVEAFATFAPLRAVHDSLLALGQALRRHVPVALALHSGAYALAGRCAVAVPDCMDEVDALDGETRGVLARADSDLHVYEGATRGVATGRVASVDSSVNTKEVIRMLVYGYGPRSVASAAMRRLNGESKDPVAIGMRKAELALAMRDTVTARTALRDVIHRLQGPKEERGLWVGSWSLPLTRAMEGWFSVLAGDTARGITQMADGIRAGGFDGEANQEAAMINEEMLIVMAAYAPTRAEGIKRLTWKATADDYGRPMVRWHLARALDAYGDRVAAAAEYRRFADLWRHADPEYQHFATEARDRANLLAPAGGR